MLGAARLLGCAATSAEPAAEVSIVYHYSSSTRGLMSSTLELVPTRHHISSVSTLADGSCLMEEVRTDATGRVLDGKASLAASSCGNVVGSPLSCASWMPPAADGSRFRTVVFDAARGTVDVSTPRFHTRRHVPHDFPWVWTSLLRERASGAPIATPLGAIIAMRAASAAHALRWLNSETFETHTIMADQVLVPNEGSVTAVLGDDWADLTAGIPTRMHLAALQTYLQIDSMQSAPTALARSTKTAIRTSTR